MSISSSNRASHACPSGSPPGYLYPGNAEARRPGNVRIHQVLRTIFDYARRRGLGVYHQLTPAYIDPSPLGDPDPYRGVGWYTEKAGHGGICWSQPEARELAQKMVRLEMEYFSPVDGYVVWFYDPAGCFCDQCKPNQLGVLYDQYQSIAARETTSVPEPACRPYSGPHGFSAIRARRHSLQRGGARRLREGLPRAACGGKPAAHGLHHGQLRRRVYKYLQRPGGPHRFPAQRVLSTACSAIRAKPRISSCPTDSGSRAACWGRRAMPTSRSPRSMITTRR